MSDCLPGRLSLQIFTHLVGLVRQDVLELLLFLTEHLALSFRVSDVLLHCANHVLALLRGLKGTYLKFVEGGLDVAR